MNRQNTKRIPKYIGLGLLLAVFIGGLSLPVTVNARQIEDPEIKKGQMAAEACKKESKKADKNGDSKYASCITGFKAGINGEKKNKACDKDPYPAVCKAGFDKGKAEAPSEDSSASNSGSSSQTHKDDPALECNNMSDMKCNLVKKYLSPFITFLSALVGLAVTIGIISGGIRYASSEGDPQKAAAGKNQIRGAIIALVFFIFLYAAINWLVPGGI